MKTQLKLAAGTVATLGVAAVPASAAAGAGTPVSRSPFAITAGPFAPCYTAGFSITVPLTGGTPGDEYDANLLQGTNNIDTGGGGDTFSSTGTGSVTFTDPTPEFSTRGAITGIPITVTVDDYPQDGSAMVTSTIGTIKMTQLGYTIAKSELKPSAPRAFAFSGYYFDANDYGFITNATGSKILRTFHIGRSNACGYVKGKAPLGPASGAPGSYRFYVYPGPKLNERLAIGYEKYTLFRPL